MKIRKPVAPRSGPVKTKSATTTGMSLLSLARGAGPGVNPFVGVNGIFGNHMWVFAAAYVTATTLSQSPFMVFRETDTQLKQRQKESEFLKVPYAPRYGKNRMAVLRHLSGGTVSRAVLKGLEPIPGHPLNVLLTKPNPLLTSTQFIQVMTLHLRCSGECMVIFLNELGEPVGPGEVPTEQWIIPKGFYVPLLEDGSFGRLSGWRITLPIYLRNSYGMTEDYPLSACMHVKNPHPNNPLCGISPVEIAAGAINIDNQTDDYNNALLANSAEPSGVLTLEQSLTPKEEDDLLAAWNQRNTGRNRGRTNILTNGMKYEQIALTPKDMEHIESKKWNRETLLAVLGVPQSTLGITDYVNYATQLGQDFNFWSQTILPTMRVIEDAYDAHLLYEQPDNVVAAFDTRNVEALRAGLADKVEIAARLSGEELRVPPKVSFETVSLEIASYPGDDESSYNSAAQAQAAQQTLLDQQAQQQTDQPPADTPPPKKSLQDIESQVATLKSGRSDDFIAVHSPCESALERDFQSWLNEERDLTISAAESAFAKKAIMPSKIVPDAAASRKRLAAASRKSFDQMLPAIYEFTKNDVDEASMPELDSAILTSIVERRAGTFARYYSQRLVRLLLREMRLAARGNETLTQVKERILRVFRSQKTKTRTITVARLETTGLMNEIRDAIFQESGVAMEIWVSSRDEAVRETHRIYDVAPPQKRGFNYLTLLPKRLRRAENSGKKLRYPGDAQGPIHETARCRCIKVPVK